LFMELLVNKPSTGLEVPVEVLQMEAHQVVLVVVHLEDPQGDQAIPSIRQVGLVVAQEEVHKEDLEEVTEAMGVVKEMEVNLALWKKQFQVYQVMTILSLLKFRKHPFFVTDKPMEVIMLIPKLSAKHSIFVLMMEMVV